MDTLPNEILIKILSNLDTKSLQVCKKVSNLWKEICDPEIAKRIETFNKLTLIDETKKEIGSILPPPVDDSSISLRSLLIYEQTFLPSRYAISTKTEPQVGSFLKYIRSSRNCDCCKDIDKCIVSSIHFMPCYNLLIVQIPGKFIFYNEMDIYSNWSTSASTSSDINEGGLNREPYEYETSLIKLNVNNAHTLTSVYHNYVVYQENPRTLLLFKINSVNHEERKAQVEMVRRVFFPLWICALHFFNEKLFVIYTTGFVGCWDRIKDDIFMSSENLTLAADEDMTKIFRILNLLFIKQTSPGNENHWTLLDGNSTSLELVQNVKLEKLFSKVFNIKVGDISSLSILNNGVFIHCKEKDEENEGFYVARLKRDPILDDFLPSNINDFENLFFKVLSRQSSDNFLSFNGTYSPPIVISPFLDNYTQHSASLITYFLAIEKTNRKCQHSTNKKILQIVSINIKNK